MPDVDLFGDRLAGHSGDALVVLVSFLLSYLFIRTSARMSRRVSWWPGGVQSGGVHLHHLVWGICLLLICGFFSFAGPFGPPWQALIAIGFGIGVGFTLDEFALWIHLDDVYWSEQGRISFDAVVIAVAVATLVVLGLRPFGGDDEGSRWVAGLSIALVAAIAIVAFLKGRILLGVVGIFIPFFAIYGAVRLATPGSPWARRYGAAKLARSKRRFDSSKPEARWTRAVQEFFSGKPSPDSAEQPPVEPGKDPRFPHKRS